MKNTKIINLFGAAGSGKSTQAYGIAYKLKLANLSAEYIHEYVKNKVFLGDHNILMKQNYIFEKQRFYQNVALGQTDYIICDSPVVLSAFYGKKYNNPHISEEWLTYVWSEFNKQSNINFFITRNPNVQFEESGRMQKSEESLQDQSDMRLWLNEHNINYTEIQSSDIAVSKMIEKILHE